MNAADRVSLGGVRSRPPNGRNPDRRIHAELVTISPSAARPGASRWLPSWPKLAIARSIDRAAAWIGPVTWRRLHAIGLADIWVIFLGSKLKRPGCHWRYWIPVAAMALGLGSGMAARHDDSWQV